MPSTSLTLPVDLPFRVDVASINKSNFWPGLNVDTVTLDRLFLRPQRSTVESSSSSATDESNPWGLAFSWMAGEPRRCKPEGLCLCAKASSPNNSEKSRMRSDMLSCFFIALFRAGRVSFLSQTPCHHHSRVFRAISSIDCFDIETVAATFETPTLKKPARCFHFSDVRIPYLWTRNLIQRARRSLMSLPGQVAVSQAQVL